MVNIFSWSCAHTSQCVYTTCVHFCRVQTIAVIARILLYSFAWIAGVSMDAWFRKTTFALASLVLLCIGWVYIIIIHGTIFHYSNGNSYRYCNISSLPYSQPIFILENVLIPPLSTKGMSSQSCFVAPKPKCFLNLMMHVTGRKMQCTNLLPLGERWKREKRQGEKEGRENMQYSSVGIQIWVILPILKDHRMKFSKSARF